MRTSKHCGILWVLGSSSVNAPQSFTRNDHRDRPRASVCGFSVAGANCGRRKSVAGYVVHIIGITGPLVLTLPSSSVLPSSPPSTMSRSTMLSLSPALEKLSLSPALQKLSLSPALQKLSLSPTLQKLSQTIKGS